jgi:hypothetical protein
VACRVEIKIDVEIVALVWALSLHEYFANAVKRMCLSSVEQFGRTERKTSMSESLLCKKKGVLNDPSIRTFFLFRGAQL